MVKCVEVRSDLTRTVERAATQTDDEQSQALPAVALALAPPRSRQAGKVAARERSKCHLPPLADHPSVSGCGTGLGQSKHLSPRDDDNAYPVLMAGWDSHF
jgi:hypothetical protein